MTAPIRTLGTRWRAAPVLAQDAVVAVLLALAAFAPGLRHNGVVLAQLPERPLDALGVVLALGQGLPLVLRRRAPALALGLVALCFAAYQGLGYGSLFAGVGLLVALYSCGAHQRRARGAVALAAGAAYVLLAVVLHALGSPQRTTDYATFALVLAACWAAGAWVRARAATEAERRGLAERTATAVERARIARELHDVVTHHVTAMVVQADAATFLTAQPERTATALGDIAASGRAALVELRHQLGVLSDPAPGAHDAAEGAGATRAPAVGRLADLVARTAAAGQPVHLVERGGPRALSDGVALAVHRVVQESLTNALKHAPSRPTTVAVDYGPESVQVEVTTRAGEGPVPRATASTSAGPGRGLAGLRERVAVLGGQLQAGPRPDGGFGVHARIPTQQQP